MKKRYVDYIKKIANSSEKISDEQFKLICDMYDSYSFKEPIKQPIFNKAYIVHKEPQNVVLNVLDKKLSIYLNHIATTDMKK